jgi:hypothetical protein
MHEFGLKHMDKILGAKLTSISEEEPS